MSSKRKNQYASSSTVQQSSEKDITRQIEKLFETPDSDVDPISFNDSRSYVKAMKEALSSASSSKEWDDQLFALKQIMSLIKGGACNHNTFVQQLTQAVPLISENIGVSRSTLVKTSCLLISQISMTIGPQFETGAETLIPVLMKPTMCGTQIISDSCSHAIKCIVQYVTTLKIAKCIVAQCNSRSSVHRTLCSKCFCIMVDFWDVSILERVRAIISPAIDKLTTDASPEARASAREAKANLSEKAKNMKTPEKPSDNAKSMVEPSSKRRSASVDHRRKINIDRSLKLDDVKQMIIMGDESAIKEHANDVAKLIVNGLTGTSPINTTSCFTLYTETVNVIPDTYKKDFDKIVKTLYEYDAGENQKQKKLADTALEASATAFGPSDVVQAGLKRRNPLSNREIIMSIVGKNDGCITKEVIAQYEKAFGIVKAGDDSLMFEKPPEPKQQVQKPVESNEPKKEEPKQVGNESPLSKQPVQNLAMTLPSRKPAILPGSNSPQRKLEIKPIEIHEAPQLEITPNQKTVIVPEIDNGSVTSPSPLTNQQDEREIEKEKEPIKEKIPQTSFKPQQSSPERNSFAQKQVDLRPKKEMQPIRQKKVVGETRFSRAPFSTDFDPVEEPDSQAEKLVALLEGPNTGSTLNAILQFTNKHGARDYRVILPCVLPFWHTEFKSETQLIVDAIIRNVQHPQLLDIGSSLLPACSREAAEFLSLVSKVCSAGEVMDASPLFMGGLKRLAQDPLPVVRKSAIFCIVDMWIAAGDDFVSEVKLLPPLTKKLVVHYYNQKK